MNVAGNSEITQNSNVVSLFSSLEVELPDPLQELLDEAETMREVEEEIQMAPRVLVTEEQFPDQSIYLLEQQLSNLNTSMSRLKFYLSDIDDLLPIK